MVFVWTPFTTTAWPHAQTTVISRFGTSGTLHRRSCHSTREASRHPRHRPLWSAFNSHLSAQDYLHLCPRRRHVSRCGIFRRELCVPTDQRQEWKATTAWMPMDSRDQEPRAACCPEATTKMVFIQCASPNQRRLKLAFLSCGSLEEVCLRYCSLVLLYCGPLSLLI